MLFFSFLRMVGFSVNSVFVHYFCDESFVNNIL